MSFIMVFSVSSSHKNLSSEKKCIIQFMWQIHGNQEIYMYFFFFL